jgi:hypothetical protein
MEDRGWISYLKSSILYARLRSSIFYPRSSDSSAGCALQQYSITLFLSLNQTARPGYNRRYRSSFEINDAALKCGRCGFGPVAHPELSQQVVDMNFDGAFRNMQS